MRLDRIIAVRNRKTVYRDGELCIKVFNEGYSKADILYEALNQARAEETGLRVPKILEITVMDGKWVIVSEYIQGKTLSRLMKENPDKKDAYLNMFVDLQMEVQAKICPPLSQQHDVMNRKISKTDFDATARYDLCARLDGMPKHHKFCHGDFNPSNIIIAQDGSPYILDWSHATQGNAAADAITTYLEFVLAGNPADAERYFDLFCEKSGTSRRYMQKWIPIVAACQSVRENENERRFFQDLVITADYR